MRIETNKTYRESMEFIEAVNKIAYAGIGSNMSIYVEVSPVMTTLVAKLFIKHGMHIPHTQAKFHRFDQRLAERYWELSSGSQT